MREARSLSRTALRWTTLGLELVEHVPDDPEEGVLYVSMAYSTAVHKCCCGCGREVVTPLGPEDWRFSCEGDLATLDPSVGNGRTCGSHYWVRKGEVIWV